jgi:uncharacterized protein YndB with AHSA1/START domain
MQQATEQDFELQVEIAAPPEAVLEALGTAAGIAAWWTAQVEGEVEAGRAFRVRFGRGGWTDLRVDRLDPRAIEWTCTGQEIADFTPTDEWVGTRMSFDLVEAGEGRTRLEFVHHGLRPLGCIGVCERGWGQHLGRSLKQLLEEGAGEPVMGAG